MVKKNKILIFFLLITTTLFLTSCKKNTPTFDETTYPVQQGCTSKCLIFNGTLKDKYSNLPLIGAKVYFEWSSFALELPPPNRKIAFTSTDSLGNYYLKFTPKSDDLYDGYYSVTTFEGSHVSKNVSVNSGDSVIVDKPFQLNFNLYPKATLKFHPVTSNSMALQLSAAEYYDYIDIKKSDIGQTISIDVIAGTTINVQKLYDGHTVNDAILLKTGEVKDYNM